MKRITNIALIIALMSCIVLVPSACFAQNMLRKLGRGLANIITSPIEIPKSVQESFYEDGPVAAGTYGVLDGVYKFVARTLVGVYEVVSFPFPLPADYAPIVEPEFLFSPHEQ